MLTALRETRHIMVESSVKRKDLSKQYACAIAYMDLQQTQQAVNISALPLYAQQVNMLGVNDKFLKEVTLSKLPIPVRVLQQFFVEHVMMELEQTLNSKVQNLAKFCSCQDTGIYCFLMALILYRSIGFACAKTQGNASGTKAIHGKGCCKNWCTVILFIQGMHWMLWN